MKKNMNYQIFHTKERKQKSSAPVDEVVGASVFYSLFLRDHLTHVCYALQNIEFFLLSCQYHTLDNCQKQNNLYRVYVMVKD